MSVASVVQRERRCVRALSDSTSPIAVSGASGLSEPTRRPLQILLRAQCTALMTTPAKRRLRSIEKGNDARLDSVVTDSVTAREWAH